ncbi:hypothetical protein OPT61_g4095 [Boeremia exigua]|uniref:Uncharacterized protein n=1 Tax=Boeremia exigua TaxID=749465 RepID=A0ACC2IFA4_9PLEO|nr:hypothetical protein OPT61_g4095 [Boeremia exigua]
MSLGNAFNSVAGDENFNLQHSFCFADTFDVTTNGLFVPAVDIFGTLDDTCVSPNLFNGPQDQPADALWPPQAANDATQDCNMSPQNLQLIRDFINDTPATVDSTSHHFNISTPLSDTIVIPPVSTKVKRTAIKTPPKRTPKASTKSITRVAKKPRSTPKKTQHQRTASSTSTASTISTTSSSPSRHRTIDELLAANFYSLNENERARLLLPMLRNIDPHALEPSFAEPPSMQAKGPGHEVRVDYTILESPPTQTDDMLATELTLSTFPPELTAAVTTPPAPISSAASVTKELSLDDLSEKFGTMRQREALEKAASQQMQDKKRWY